MKSELPRVTEYVNSDTGKAEREFDFWWNETDPHLSLFQHVGKIERAQMYRKLKNIRHARLYSNLETLGFNVSLYAQNITDQFQGTPVTYNVISACIDTLTAKLATKKPRPYFITDNGDYSLQTKAKDTSKFLLGQTEAMGLYEKLQKSQWHAFIFGTGAVKFFKDGDDIKCENVLIDELIVDDADAIYGNPRCLYQTKYVNRAELALRFPEYMDKIKAAGNGLPSHIASADAKALVKVVEGWKRASGKDTKDGRHVIALDSVTLIDEEYEKQTFPFVFHKHKNSITGFFGVGVAEELTGIQLEINKILRTIQRAQHIMCVPRVWIDANSEINTAHITNEPGAIGKFRGTPPIISVGQGASPELYQHLESLYRKAFDLVGVSMLSATSQKPTGLNSGIAMRTYQDIESERFAVVETNFQNSFLEAWNLILDLMSEMDNKKVKIDSGRFIDVKSWSQVRMNEDKYILKCYPTSLLPTKPEGKLQTIQELIQSGFIEKDMAMTLLDLPDLDKFMSLQSAAVDVVYKAIELAIDKGEYMSPEPFQPNLVQAKEIVQTAYLRYKTQDVPFERLELLIRYMEDVQDLLDKAQAAMMQEQASNQAALGNPEARPTSELMPFGG